MEHFDALKTGNKIELEKILKNVSIKLIKYNKLVSLKEPHYLKRYNPLYIAVENRSDEIINLLLISVYRKNSKIEKDNVYTFPLWTFDLLPNSKANYRLYAFDPFNEKFNGIEVHLTNIEDWMHRPIGGEIMKKPYENSKKLTWWENLLHTTSYLKNCGQM